MYTWMFARQRNEATMCSGELQSELGGRGEAPRLKAGLSFMMQTSAGF